MSASTSPVRWQQGRVRVAVPATSANLGPGYDCLGLSLELHDQLEAEVAGSGPALTVEVEGESAEEVPRDEQHLVVRCMRVVFEELAVSPPALRLRCRNTVPHSRGMGSSSAAIVGGLVLARALVQAGAEVLDDAALLGLANRIEGHPDNVAPALFGGLVVAGQAGGEVWAQRLPLDPRVSAVVFVPPTRVATEVARGALPAQVSHADAAANTGRAALLVGALGGAPEMLWRGTEDFVHQQARAGAMPDSFELVQRLRADGLPAVISGAGPTVLCFVAPGTDLPYADADAVLARVPSGWEARHVAVGGAGARVLE